LFVPVQILGITLKGLHVYSKTKRSYFTTPKGSHDFEEHGWAEIHSRRCVTPSESRSGSFCHPFWRSSFYGNARRLARYAYDRCAEMVSGQICHRHQKHGLALLIHFVLDFFIFGAGAMILAGSVK
jgi:hypothetical protein